MSAEQKKIKVIILSAIGSGGHALCAQAIEQAFSLYSLNKPQVLRSSWSEIFCPFWGKVGAWFYFKFTRYFPFFWDLCYDKKTLQKFLFPLIDILSKIKTPAIKKFIQKEQPDLIICTHGFVCRMLAKQKADGVFSAALVAVSTDYLAHSYWVHQSIDFYCLASQESKKYFMQKGIRPEKIQVLGIPIDPIFYKHTDQKKARQLLGLKPDKPVVLIMGGTLGLGPIRQTVQTLQSFSKEIEVLLAPGQNKSLQKKDPHLVKKIDNTQIALWMDACDFVISKPGGLTCAQSQAKQLPMVFFYALGGQEKRNAQYLRSSKNIFIAYSQKELKNCLKKLFLSSKKTVFLEDKLISNSAQNLVVALEKQFFLR